MSWENARHDAIAGVFQAQLNRDEFKAAPSFDREQLANPCYGWDEQAMRYFSAVGTPANAQPT